jgi:hypothetical protein
MSTRPVIDWQRVRADYETGAYTLQALCERHGIKHRSTIQNRITRESWVKDPTSEVRRIRGAKLARLDASEQECEQGGSCEHPVYDRNKSVVVEAAAERQVQVVAQHRVMISKLRGNVERVLDLVHNYLHGNQEQRIEAMLILKMASSDSLTGHLNSLSANIQRIVTMERESYGLSDIDPGMNADRAETLRNEIHERLARLADGG